MTTRYPAGFKFKEWRWDQRLTDYGEPIETCELCGNTGLRYHYEIEHEAEEPPMQVGSACILKFDIAVYDEHGRLIEDGEERRKLLDRAIARHQRQECIEAVRALQRLSPSGAVTAALEPLLKGKSLTLQAVTTVLWLLKKYRIPHRPKFFPVRLPKKDLSRLPLMEDWRLHHLLGALTDVQYRRVDEYSRTCVTPRSSAAAGGRMA